MGEAVLTGCHSEAIIGPGRSVVLIGERLNPTERGGLAAELRACDLERVAREAVLQVKAGSHMSNINAGVPDILLASVVSRVQAVVDVPLAIDSAVPAALTEGLGAYEGKALVNSVTGQLRLKEAWRRTCRWSPPTAQRWWLSPPTSRGSPMIQRSGSRSPERSSSAPATMGFGAFGEEDSSRP